MLFKGLIAAMTFSLAGLSGCIKSSAPTASSNSTTGTNSAGVAESKIKDLGVLQLTNLYETCVAVGKNKDCRIVPKVLGRHDLQLTLTVESKGTDGTTSGLSVVQMVGNDQKPFQFSIGNTDYTFTPQLADK